ncbi:MAG: alpha-galactosidase [Abditibacteriota bacterium]|nr:alpha-galactosidase [Abditibacteriota bacterium]
MNHLSTICVAAAALATLAGSAFAAKPAVSEMKAADLGFAAMFEAPKAEKQLPFSFVYDGKSSKDLLKGWKCKESTKAVSATKTERTVTYKDPATKLEVKCVATHFADSPVIEWTVWFENKGKTPTPTIEKVYAIDETLQSNKDNFTMHWDVGTLVTSHDAEPMTDVLGAGDTFVKSPGRASCGGVNPYFNIECGKNQGYIVVVGWPGQWEMNCAVDNTGKNLNVKAGQQNLATTLNPGEKLRTPLMAVMPYQGDYVHAQNLWRAYFVKYVTPQVNGAAAPAELHACSSHQYAEMILANTQTQIDYIDGYLNRGVDLDFWWMDAGWYYHKGQGWPNTGTWEVDRDRFPKGLREISDHAHKKGVKIIVWFEPERVGGDNWITENHPDWIYEGTGLVDIGNPEVWNWATKHFDGLIKSEGIDLYRQDYNINPNDAWTRWNGKNPGRIGYSENRYVQGYLSYWDYLLEHNPGLRIDSCASGGHRNDLETMKRAVPLLRSDYIFEPVGQQNHTYGMSFWIPWQGTGFRTESLYDLRSSMVMGQTACWTISDDNLDYDLLLKYLKEWREVAPNFLGDYYPLTKYNPENNAWMAMQFDRPEAGVGSVQVYRRGEAEEDSITLKLKGLAYDASYEVYDFDRGTVGTFTGSELMRKGIKVSLDKAEAALIKYTKK